MAIPREYAPEVGDVCEFDFKEGWSDPHKVVVKAIVDGEVWLYHIEDKYNTFVSFSRASFRQIKTPEQVEEEKAINGMAKLIMKIPHLVFSPDVTIDVAKDLHEAGYQNQPKVKPLTFKEYYKAIDDADTYFDSWRLLISRDHIIEAKEKDSD